MGLAMRTQPTKVETEETYAVRATIKGLDKLEREYLRDEKLKLACRAARAGFAKALKEKEIEG